MKNAETPAKLLEVLQKAKSAKQIDSSVVGAAVQHCGFQRWWHVLLEVHQLQERQQLGDGLGRRLLLSALARCVKDKTLNAAELEARGRKALELGKQTWIALPEPESEVAFCSALGSAWSLCDAVCSEESLQWADELHRWSETQNFMATAQTWTPLLLVLEKCKQHDRVDTLLRQMWANNMIDHVLLSGLIDSAGQIFLWSRADRIWHRFIHRYKVLPNAICYEAYAKAHLLSGRPAAAVKILHNLDCQNVLGKDEVAANVAIICLQALAIVYRSSTSKQAKNELLRYLNKTSRFGTFHGGDEGSVESAVFYQQTTRVQS